MMYGVYGCMAVCAVCAVYAVYPDRRAVTRRAGCIRMKYSLYSKFSYRKVHSPTPYLPLALGHRWPWDQVGGARVGRGTVALRYLGCLPTISSSISGKTLKGLEDSPSGRSIHHFAIQQSIQDLAVYHTYTAPSPRHGSPVRIYSVYSTYSLYSHTAIHAIHHTALYSLPQDPPHTAPPRLVRLPPQHTPSPSLTSLILAPRPPPFAW